MKIIVGKFAGFCGGVANAVSESLKILDNNQIVYALGKIAHNKQVIDDLERKGLITVEDINDVPNNQILIIRAHGVPKEIYYIAKNKNLQLIDLTCPKVLHIQNIAKQYAQKGYYIILFGDPNHPEVLGIESHCGDNYFILIDDVNLEKTINGIGNKVVVIAQSTFNNEKFIEYSKIIKEKIHDVEIINTICGATRLRQLETERLANQAEAIIIIGGKNSSNTIKLFDIASANCKQTIHIEDKNELKLEEIKKYQSIGIMAGASTPQKSIDEVVECLLQK